MTKIIEYLTILPAEMLNVSVFNEVLFIFCINFLNFYRLFEVSSLQKGRQQQDMQILVEWEAYLYRVL